MWFSNIALTGLGGWDLHGCGDVGGHGGVLGLVDGVHGGHVGCVHLWERGN